MPAGMLALCAETPGRIFFARTQTVTFWASRQMRLYGTAARGSVTANSPYVAETEVAMVACRRMASLIFGIVVARLPLD